ncbi:MAG: nucleotidyltransferase family protein [Desulfobacterales bacterium]|nr:nucleotidyltransferase family protein [Desulfobacterales bacterium]
MESSLRTLLALLAITPAITNKRSRFVELLLKRRNADPLINMALKEGLAGILYKNLLKSGSLDSLNKGHQEILQSAYYRTLHLNLKLNHALKKILSTLNQGGVQVVLLQGMELLHGIYGDFGLRPLSDIDLWVLEKDYTKLVSILRNQGYRLDPLYPNTFRKGITVLDIHTHILWADRIRSREWLLTKSQDFIYQKTRFISVDGQQVRSLGRYDQVLYLGLHLLKHNAERLIWLVDIKKLVADWTFSDWQALLTRARELGQEKCVTYICYLLKLLLNFTEPGRICPEIHRLKLNPIEKKLLRLRQKKESLPEWSTLILFTSGKGLLKGIMFILETLFPRSDILRQVFAETPGLSVPQLYTRRFFQLAGRAVTSLFK